MAQVLTKEKMKLTEDQKKLVDDNIGLAYGYFHKYLLEEEKCKFSQEEIISKLFEGLCLAARRFDPTRGVQFSTYVYRTLGLNHSRERSKKIEYKTHHVPLCDEHLNNQTYVFQPLHKVDWIKMEILFKKVHLTSEQKKILRCYYQRKMTLRQIGKKEGVTAEAIRVRLKTSINKIKSYIKVRNEDINNFYKEEWE